MIYVILILMIIPLFIVAIGISVSAPRYTGPISDHFNGRRFLNPEGMKAKGGLDVLRWMMNRKRGSWKEEFTEPDSKRPPDHYKDGIRITFINHSTFLIQVDGINILTDPIWSERTSPFSFVGPKRMRRPGIKLENLPRIHLVLLTHNHYDHLDVSTMRTIFGAHHPKIVTALGINSFLDKEFIKGATACDWWEKVAVGNSLEIQAVPAQHFSGRGLIDRDATLWCGYVIKTSQGNIYYAGDTGYNARTFKEIGTRGGPIRVSMLPIGAYQPGWFMSPIHTSPEEAVKIHQDVQSQNSIAMHFGTFPLADDGCMDPINDLKAASEKYSLKPDEFIAMKEGEFRVFEKLP